MEARCLGLWGRSAPFKARILGGPGGYYGVSENLPAGLVDPVGGFHGSPVFDLPQGRQEFQGSDFADPPLAEEGKNIIFQAVDDSFAVARSPGVTGALHPFPGDHLKAVLHTQDTGQFAGLFDMAGVIALKKLFPGLVAPLAGLFEADFGVYSHGNAFFLAQQGVAKTPPFAAIGANLQVQAILVKEFVGPFTGGRVGDLFVVQLHRATLFQVG